MTAASIAVVLYEGPGSAPLTDDRRVGLLRALLDKGYAVSRVIGRSVSAPADARQLLVVGRFAGGSAAASANATGADTRMQFEDLDSVDDGAVLARLESINRDAEAPAPGKWKPWFPVIDYSRCTNCMQCLSFCLFDVYGVREGKIQVQNQDHCKTDCPACSRVCPEVAIMFPKYRHGPINGDVVSADDVRREAMKVDISALLGGDIYAALRDRSAKAKSRFSKERDEDRALTERQNCLIKLQQQMDLDIPAEVLAALPSPDEIRAKAEAAASRAAEAKRTASIKPGEQSS